jgi:hypothetical protein
MWSSDYAMYIVLGCVLIVTCSILAALYMVYKSKCDDIKEKKVENAKIAQMREELAALKLIKQEKDVWDTAFQPHVHPEHNEIDHFVVIGSAIVLVGMVLYRRRLKRKRTQVRAAVSPENMIAFENFPANLRQDDAEEEKTEDLLAVVRSIHAADEAPRITVTGVPLSPQIAATPLPTTAPTFANHLGQTAAHPSTRAPGMGVHAATGNIHVQAATRVPGS